MNSLASTEKNPIKIHSGDAITGDLYFTLKEGEAEAESHEYGMLRYVNIRQS